MQRPGPDALSISREFDLKESLWSRASFTKGLLSFVFAKNKRK